jgi:type I restriction enzyme R subunit
LFALSKGAQAPLEPQHSPLHLIPNQGAPIRRDLKQQIPALFNANALLVTSDGIAARVGSLSADLERFMPWRTTDGQKILAKGLPELPTLIEGVFEQRRFLDLLRHFTVFGDTGKGLVKIVAGYHQYHAVNRAIESTLRAADPHQVAGEEPAHYGLPSVKTQLKSDRRAGVIWDRVRVEAYVSHEHPV